MRNCFNVKCKLMTLDQVHKLHQENKIIIEYM